MADFPETIEPVLAEFFGVLNVEHIHARLHAMQSDAQIGRMALLPRPELAQRAVLAEDFQFKTRGLYQAIIAEYGEDPSGWKLPESIQAAVGELLALYFANAPGDHSAASGVEPVSYVSGRRLGRGRAGR